MSFDIGCCNKEMRFHDDFPYQTNRRSAHPEGQPQSCFFRADAAFPRSGRFRRIAPLDFAMRICGDAVNQLINGCTHWVTREDQTIFTRTTQLWIHLPA